MRKDRVAHGARVSRFRGRRRVCKEMGGEGGGIGEDFRTVRTWGATICGGRFSEYYAHDVVSN